MAILFLLLFPLLAFSLYLIPLGLFYLASCIAVWLDKRDII
jgi:hypothetical protein